MSDIGGQYYGIGDYASAVFYYKKYLSLKVQFSVRRKINSLTTLAFIERKRGRYERALAILRDALKLSESTADNEWVGLTNGNIGEIYFLMKEYGQAVPYLLNDLKISVALQSFESAAGSSAILGGVYIANANPKLAKQYLDSSLALLKRVMGKTSLSAARLKSYRYLAEYYTHKKQFDKANQYLQLAWNIRDSVLQKNNDEQSRLHVSEFSEDRKRQNLRIMQSVIERKNTNEWLFSALLITALIIIGFIFLLLKQNQKLNKILHEKNIDVVKENNDMQVKKDELTISNDTKNKLFSIIAHDLRTPVVNLQGLLSLMQQGLMDKEELNQYLPFVSAKVNVLSETIDNLLTWTHSQMEGIVANPQTVNVYNLVQKVFTQLQPSSEKKQITLSNTIPERTIITADINQMEIVIRNLVSNAIKFSYEKGIVTVSATTIDNKTAITVADNGVGADKEKLSKIFKRQLQGSTQGTHGEKGIGLGLIICKDFVEKNKGSIDASQNNPAGTVFTIELPA